MRIRLLPALALGAALALPCAAETPNPSGRTMADVLAKLEAFAVAEMAAEKVPGVAYAVVKDGQVVFAKGYGKRKLTDATDTVTTGTLFEIASTTKAFTSALVAMEVEAGKLGWDDRVVTHLPDFQLYDPWVTAEFRVADLMAQRSGMPASALDPMPLFGYSREDAIRAHRYVEPTFSFRGGFAYVNELWLVAARLVEKVEGMTWEEAVTSRIFQPLAMRESTVDGALALLVADRATGYYADASGALVAIPDDFAFWDVIEHAGPAGSIRSTVLDFARWASFQLGHGTLGGTTLLSAATVEAMHAPRTYITSFVEAGGVRRTISYGLGWMHDERTTGTIVWHNGLSYGQHSIVALYELPNVALVVLTNSAGNLIPDKMRTELFDLLQVPPGAAPAARGPDLAVKTLARPDEARAPLAPIPPLPLERYVGTYENPAYGRVTVKLESGTLVMFGGPRPATGALVPWSGNTFAWKAQLELQPKDSTVTFTVPAGQNASRLIASACKDVRGGLFVRVP